MLKKTANPACNTKHKYGRCFGSQGVAAARQIADHLDKVPHTKYVEPLVGLGTVYRATQPAKEEILNDLDCKRLRIAKQKSCASSETQCERIKAAKLSCGTDYREIIRKNDSSDTLIYLDPPYHTSAKSSKNYGRNELDFKQFAQAAKGIKDAKVAVSYSDTPDFRQEFCNDGFTCHRIKKNMFSAHYHELLAIRD
jgi:site-specific DNA-adenine methylase